MSVNKKKNEGARGERLSRTAKVVIFIGSLLSALLLWIYAIGYDSTLFERTFDGIEVVIEGEELLASNKGYTLAEGQRFSSVTVVAKGKRSELNELDPEDFRAVVDVSKATSAGQQILDIVVYSPNGIEVVSQSSATVSVFVDEFTQRNEMISVSVDTGNNYVMTDGVSFIDAVANPLSVTVSGPKSVLDTIEGAYVKFPLDGHEISEHIYGYGPIELRDANGKVIDNPYITVSDSTAYVSITVTKQKTVPVQVVFTGGIFDPSDVDVTLSSHSIVVSGYPEVLDSFNELVLKIDESTIDGSDDFDYLVSAMLPAGIRNVSGFSKISVNVVLPALSVREYTIPSASITVANVPVGNTYQINHSVTVTLIGPRNAFADFDPALISISADFDRVKVESDGSYTSEVTVTLGGENSGIYVQSKTYTVNYTIVPEPVEPAEPSVTAPNETSGVE